VLTLKYDSTINRNKNETIRIKSYEKKILKDQENILFVNEMLKNNANFLKNSEIYTSGIREPSITKKPKVSSLSKKLERLGIENSKSLYESGMYILCTYIDMHLYMYIRMCMYIYLCI
jgi:hypothetical protein